MGNMYKKSAFLILHCSVLLHFSIGNVLYRAMVHARSKIKNYNLRTAKETITVFFSFAACTKFFEWGSKSHHPSPILQRGWLSRRQNTVYEYHGCIFHGCRKCYPKQGNMKRFCHPDRTVSEVYEATLKKTAILRDAGYTVIEIWGCDFAKQKETNPELTELLEKFEFVPLLEPRDAFFGGRTGATTLYAKTAEEEEISYVDFTSLYPSINKYGTYPVGFPQIIYRPENQNIGDYFGLAQVDNLAPERLFHPILPVRAGGKLTFPLCRFCVEEEIANPLLERSNMCGHTREQRMLKGTWCTPELLKAVEKGYEILKIHEVWHFPEENRREGLFAGYVNTWLKLKQESAGWPAGTETEEQKAAYIRD